MSDLVGTPGGTGRAANGGSRAAQGPVPVPQGSPAGVRTPRDVMNARAQREQRKKQQAEEEARAAAEEQRKAQEEERRRSAERRAAAAGVAGQSTRHSGGYRREYDQGFGMGEPVNPPTIPTRPTQPPAYAHRPRATSQSQDQPRVVPQQATGAQRIQQSQAHTRQPSGTAGPSQARTDPGAGASATPIDAGSARVGGSTARDSTVSSFPHAFERWEQLSSHWEGLTSYWIRRLEQNTEEVRREPLAGQMARQITDLSAAGANLFHAVVELQRLRASSERKFQRWFFETKEQEERAREIQAQLEHSLEVERRARAQAEDALNRAQSSRRQAEKVVLESKRELQISKDEARRAWEELGRREQEERERTLALRDGQPVLIAGVQVVPMQQGMVSRQTSVSQRPKTREGLYQPGQTQPIYGVPGGRHGPIEAGEAYYEEGASPTDTDPFIETGRGGHPLHHEPDVPSLSASTYQPHPMGGSVGASSTGKSAVHPPIPQQPSVPPQSISQPAPSSSTTAAARPATTAAPFYRHRDTYLHDPSSHPTAMANLPPSDLDSQSYVPSVEDTFSEGGDDEYEYDEQGNVRLDAQGRPIIFRRGLRSEGSEEMGEAEMERERMHARRYGASQAGYVPPTTNTIIATEGGAQPLYGAGGFGTTGSVVAGSGAGGGATLNYDRVGAVDYSGAGYGSGWEGVQRHHHPTRLSDVLEEDERSRTSPSRASR